jgi:hypothetical protein
MRKIEPPTLFKAIPLRGGQHRLPVFFCQYQSRRSFLNPEILSCPIKDFTIPINRNDWRFRYPRDYPLGQLMLSDRPLDVHR